MSTTNFMKILMTAIGEINQGLINKYVTKFNELKGSQSVTAEQAKLKDLIAQKKSELKQLEEKFEALDPSITYEERDEANNNGIQICNLRRQSDIQAKKELDEAPECTNILEFQNIAERFKGMMNLAVGGKEQRNILLQFYTLDWKSLGIDVPCDLNISNIKIENGVIISDSTKLLK